MRQVARTFGAREGMLRLEYELQRGSGLLAHRMQAVAGWDSWELKKIAPSSTPAAFVESRRTGKQPFFFQGARNLTSDLKRILGDAGRELAFAQADKIIGGTVPYFGRLNCSCGFPPQWFRNPVTGQSVSSNRPWTHMRFADPEYGDLKFILEPSRFLFIYPLARAYALSGDDRFAEAFWVSVEDWAAKNPPMAGPLWICGQESSLRIMSWTFALYAFLDAPATTPKRAAILVSMIAAHAWRAAQTLGYARSQRSNHLISEAVGLWTAGTLFPELSDAKVWQQQGNDFLREAVLDQISPAGVLFQNSFNYQRMVLQQLLWVIRLAEFNQQPLDEKIRERTAAALIFIAQFVDKKSGRVPNHGSNDGSYILPLAQCDFVDYRPLLAMGNCVLNRSTHLQTGPWDEAALWVGGACAPSSDHRGSDPETVPHGATTGFHRLGTALSWALVRAGHYSRRPFQADQLHVDLWWNGINLARDAGTYLYNGERPWDNGLAGTRVHNTVTVDGHDQMRRVGRFLWVDWAQASGKSFSRLSPSADLVFDTFDGSHEGYQRLRVAHRRRVHFVAEDAWVVVDDLTGTGEHELQLNWLLPDFPVKVNSKFPFSATLSSTLSSSEQCFHWHIFSSAPGDTAIVRAGKNLGDDFSALSQRTDVFGYESPTYGELNPAISLLHRVQGTLPIRIVSVMTVGNELRLERLGDLLHLLRGSAEIHTVDLNFEQSKNEHR